MRLRTHLDLEPGVLRAQPDVAGRDQVHASTDAGPVHGCHYGLGTLEEEEEEELDEKSANQHTAHTRLKT